MNPFYQARFLSVIPSLLGASLLLLAPTGCRLIRQPAAVDYRCPNCNVVLVVIDALRADRLGVYGYARETSPHMNQLAREGIVLENAFSASTWTLPSLASLFTCLYPSEHMTGLHSTYDRLDPSIPTLAEILKQDGYTTAAITNSAYLDLYFGFMRGFDDYQNLGGKSSPHASDITSQAIQWLDRHRQDIFFLFLHYLDVHSPYNPPRPYATESDTGAAGRPTLPASVHSPHTTSSVAELEHLVALYDGEIKYVDAHIGQLLTHLTETGLRKNTLLIVTSDHGESFHRGFIGHGGLSTKDGPKLYDELIRVPMILAHPSIGGKKLTVPYQHIDLVPTLLRILGLRAPTTCSGVDVLTLPPDGTRPIVSEEFPFVVIRTKDAKLVYNRQDRVSAMLYRLGVDPEELDNRVNDSPHIVRALEKDILAWEQSVQKKVAALQLMPPDHGRSHHVISTVPMAECSAAHSRIVSTDPELVNPTAWQNHGTFLEAYAEHPGVVNIAPKDMARRLSQQIALQPNRAYELAATIRTDPKRKACECSSYAIHIKVADREVGLEETIYEDSIHSKEDWKKICLDISKFSGMDITFTIEGDFGGACIYSCAGPLLVDSFTVAELESSVDYAPPESVKKALQSLGYVE